MKYSSKISEHSLWKFLLKRWAIGLRVHNYCFVLLNRLGIATNTVFSNPRTANYWKISKTGFLCKYIVTYLLNWLHSKRDSQVMLYSQREESWFYLHWLGWNNSTKVKNAYNIMTHRVALTQRKNVMSFGFLVTRAFQQYIIPVSIIAQYFLPLLFLK